MIRNNSEYMREDGSPRYGIRTTGLEAFAEAPARPLVTVAQTADAAAQLDGAELKLAAEHRYVLDLFKEDAEVISSLREAHAEELKLAEAAVEARLASPWTWMSAAKRSYIESTIDDAEKAGTMVSQLASLLMSMGISVGSLVIMIGMVILQVPPLPYLGVCLVMLLVLVPIRRKLDRATDRTTLPHDVSKDEAQVFWDDVVNATLLAVLQNKGVEVDLATAASLTRGWNHTRYVSTVAQELRSNHAAPRT
ncbi:hypothetical protein [Paenarthrobacter sp. YJN-5]|uniref:hypothetical protein n=1 Tax=Paenarthrobacter sp. YJN-5 TaxID=2735316 RepID=UPI001878387F|nr:hypothetical protein [Paenarthrobacter sp. YJN-5]QOT19348.1 hypothetical protein HMI59_22080 [Paenarthrobacter sp. YJN-5]